MVPFPQGSADSVGAVNEAPETTADEAAVPAETPSIDLSNRPDAAWLLEVEGEVDDVELVLKCLARDSATMCTTCDGLQADGSLESRSVLARCASTKQPR